MTGEHPSMPHVCHQSMQQGVKPIQTKLTEKEWETAIMRRSVQLTTSCPLPIGHCTQPKLIRILGLYVYQTVTCTTSSPAHTTLIYSCGRVSGQMRVRSGTDDGTPPPMGTYCCHNLSKTDTDSDCSEKNRPILSVTHAWKCSRNSIYWQLCTWAFIGTYPAPFSSGIVGKLSTFP